MEPASRYPDTHLAFCRTENSNDPDILIFEFCAYHLNVLQSYKKNFLRYIVALKIFRTFENFFLFFVAEKICQGLLRHSVPMKINITEIVCLNVLLF